MESLQGQLLVAGGGLFDPNFRQAVVLVAEHTEEGAMGIVLNRPTDVAVAAAMPSLSSIDGLDDRLFFGGPVQPQTAIVLAEFEHPEFADRLVTGSIGFPEGELSPEGLRGVARARIFAGYSGWGPGQLEGELVQSAWIVDPGSPADIFSEAPERLWGSVLQRKGGDYSMLALMPFDPSTN
jgi:putative transcriptional regulator